ARSGKSILCGAPGDAVTTDCGYKPRVLTAVTNSACLRRNGAVARYAGAVCRRRQTPLSATAVSSFGRRLAFQYNPMPTRFKPTTTLEILTANESQLLPSMIGKIESTT